MASYLLDTHTLLWYFDRSPKLSKTVFQLIADQQNQLFVSVAFYWEMVIKASLKKLTLPDTIENMIRQAEEAELQSLGISGQHLSMLKSLPFYHRDPFDRLLIAQAMQNKLILLTADRSFANYQLETVW